MATPSTFYTVQQAIRMAYRDVGLLEITQEPSSEQYAEGLIRVNDLANLWQTQGLKLWLVTDQSITLVAGTATYTLGPSGSVDMTKPLRVIQAYYEDSNQIRRPLVPMSREEHTRLSQVTQTGQINSYFVDKQQTRLAVTFWLVPDTTAATGAAHLVIQTQSPVMTTLTAQHALPIEWGMALRWGLADDMSTGQPQPIVDRCAMRAATFREALEGWDVEDAPTYFAVDQRAAFSDRFPR